MITLGHARRLSGMDGFGGQHRRVYKVFTIDADNGEVHSMKLSKTSAQFIAPSPDPSPDSAAKPYCTVITALHSVGQSSRSAATLRLPSVVKPCTDRTLRLFATNLVRDPG